MVYKSIEAGARGLGMERNFFQNENPIGMIKAVRGIIHAGLTEKEAMEVCNTTHSDKLE